MKATLIVLAAALGLAGCAQGWGYAYDYDPYRGVRGHYVGPFEGRVQSAPACRRLVYTGPYSDGYREPYYAGPFCADGAAVDAAARVPDAVPAP